MKTYVSPTLMAAAAAALLAGCSSDGGVLGSSLTTSSVDATKLAAAPKLDPACIALTAKIDALRKDGVTDRVEKASAGTTPNVSVKRESLAKMAELDKANYDYQSKCSVAGLAKPMAAPVTAVAPPAAPVKPVAAKKAAAVVPANPALAAAAVAIAPAASVAPPMPVAETQAAPAAPVAQAAPIPTAP